MLLQALMKGCKRGPLVRGGTMNAYALRLMPGKFIGACVTGLLHYQYFCFPAG